MAKDVIMEFLEGQKRRQQKQKQEIAHLDSLLRWSPKYKAELDNLEKEHK